MTIREFLETYGDPNGPDWMPLGEQQIEALKWNLRVLRIMHKFKKYELNVCGVNLSLYNGTAAGLEQNYENFDQFADAEIAYKVPGLISSLEALLEFKSRPKGPYAAFKIFNALDVIASWNNKDLKDGEELPELHGMDNGHMNRFEKKYQNNWCTTADIIDWYGFIQEQLLDYVTRYLDKQFFVYFHKRRIKNLARWQKQTMLHGVFINNKVPSSVRQFWLTNYDLLYGDINLIYRYVKEEEIELLVDKMYDNVPTLNLYGNARNICGDVSKTCGHIDPGLFGDISGLTGDITNVIGDATGLVLDVTHWRLKHDMTFNDLLNLDDVRKCLAVKGQITGKYKTLSYKDNVTLMKAWRTLCYHTIGLEQDVYDRFDHPVKVKPPFPVDRWGRYYEEHDDYMRIYSVNPADIMLAKDVNKCSSCFCINSGTYRWDVGMRCLIAEITVNPNMGVVFDVFKHEMVKKLNQFNGIKFNWFDPNRASFFQYNKDNARLFSPYGSNMAADALPCFIPSYPSDIVPISGHDGIHVDQEKRQRELAYLETFIKDKYRWCAKGIENTFPLVNNYRDFTMNEISDAWKAQIARANKMAEELRAYLDANKETK